ncbi:MAG TPA: dipeptidase [Candidatus Polarisedimenticolaceae bacterium]|nr:dipeptidase [Candidatus Polarisedimenticolaceae bacterium]
MDLDSMARLALPLAMLVVLTASCRDSSPTPTPEEAAIELAQRVLILDTHIDLPFRLQEQWEDVGQRTATGDFDYPRARSGGLDVAFMSIYVPASYQESGGARLFADELIDSVERLVREHPDKFELVRGTDDIRGRAGDGKVLLAMGMENGAPIEHDLANVRHFHDRGVRYVTLAHSKANAISDSSYDEDRPWGGLSPFGREVVVEMNRVGMMIDVSHLSDDATHQAIAASRTPVIASHSSCRHFTPGWERNLSDELIREIAASGGVIQINFGSGFVDDDYRRAWLARHEQVESYFEEHQIDPESDEGKAFSKRYVRENPIEPVRAERVADHIDHVVGLVGIDHVGLGSDFDGLGDSLPHGLRDVSHYPNLLRILSERGYSPAEIEKICGANLLRVWGEVEAAAAPS